MNITNEKGFINFGAGPLVRAICVSPGGIPKHTIHNVYVDRRGLIGDGHHHEKHNRPTQSVCLQDWELLEDLRQEGFKLDCGTIGENITVMNAHVQSMTPGTVLEFAGGVTVELTKPRHPCYVLDSIDPRLKNVIAGRCGYYAQVLKEGFLEEGARINIVASS